MSSGPFPVGFALWGPVGLAALGLGFAVFGLIKPRGLAGILALLLATLTAGAAVVAQVRAEREVERFLTTGDRDNRAALERLRMYRYPHAQSVGRKVAIAALLPLLLGAVAALRRPQRGRVLPLGFVGLAVLAWGAAWHIAHRPLSVDRYDFAADDDQTWMLAIAIDGATGTTPYLEELGAGCDILDASLRTYWAHTPVPPNLEPALQLAAQRCVQGALVALRAARDPKVASALRRALLDSVLLTDPALRDQLASPLPSSQEERLSRTAGARDRLRELLGPGASTEALEDVLAAHADAGVR